MSGSPPMLGTGVSGPYPYCSMRYVVFSMRYGVLKASNTGNPSGIHTNSYVKSQRGSSSGANTASWVSQEIRFCGGKTGE